MRKLGIAVAILIVVLIGADIATRLWVQQQMATAISDNVEGVRHVRASISSFPFIGRLAVNGSISHVEIHLDGVTARPVDLSELRASVDGAVLKRGDLFDGHITVTKVTNVDLGAVFTDDDLTRASGVPVRVRPDGVTVTVAGHDVTVHVAVSGRSIQLSAAGVSASVPLPSTDFLPCTPAPHLGDGKAVLSCDSDHLPPAVVQAIGSVSLRRS